MSSDDMAGDPWLRLHAARPSGLPSLRPRKKGVMNLGWAVLLVLTVIGLALSAWLTYQDRKKEER